MQKLVYKINNDKGTQTVARTLGILTTAKTTPRKKKQISILPSNFAIF